MSLNQVVRFENINLSEKSSPSRDSWPTQLLLCIEYFLNFGFDSYKTHLR